MRTIRTIKTAIIQSIDFFSLLSVNVFCAELCSYELSDNVSDVPSADIVSVCSDSFSIVVISGEVSSSDTVSSTVVSASVVVSAAVVSAVVVSAAVVSFVVVSAAVVSCCVGFSLFSKPLLVYGEPETPDT